MRKYRMQPILRRRYKIPSWILPVLLATVLSVGTFRYISNRMYPIIRAAADSNARNLISRISASAIDHCLSSTGLSYDSFIDTATDSSGRIMSLSLRAIESSHFKRQVIDLLTQQLEQITSDELEIPLGTLTGELLFSALGPSVRVRVQSIGHVSAAYQNEFTSVGINQTKHSVYLEMTIMINLLIPGDIITVQSVERVCIAETIIIGDVPDTYLNLQKR